MQIMVVVFFFKQKTAYEMRIGDWSSDVCSSDLRRQDHYSPSYGRRSAGADSGGLQMGMLPQQPRAHLSRRRNRSFRRIPYACTNVDRKSVVSGKSVSVRVDLGGRRIIQKQPTNTEPPYVPMLKILTCTHY